MPAASPGWTNLTPLLTVSPPARRDGAVAYYPPGGSIVLFGGETASRTLGDTWSFSSASWTDVTSPAPNGTNTPSARFGASMAWDPTLGALVLFGGHGTAFDNDTWEWNGHWNLVPSSGPAPPARDFGAFAFDPTINALVLFGGNSLGGPLGDTWEFTSSGWQNLTSALGVAPSARYSAGIATDVADVELVLFGGYGGLGFDHDTWTFSGSNWTELAPTVHPGARSDPQMTYDNVTGAVLLYGGVNPSSSGARWGDLWTFSGGNWTELSGSENSTLPARSGASFAELLTTNAPGGEIVLFGGWENSTQVLGDTWLYGATLPLGATPPFSSGYIYDVGETITMSVAVVGGTPPYSYTWLGLEPAGCTTSDAASIQCTPSPSVVTTFDVSFAVSVTVSDHAGGTTTSGLAVFTIAPRPKITVFESNPSNPTENSPFTLIVRATGGTNPLNYSYLALPPGCASSDLATLPCPGTDAGVYTVLVTVTDAAGESVEGNATVVVNAPAPPPPPVTPFDIALGIALGVAAAALFGVAVYFRPKSPAPPTAPGGGP
ncbi:MAG: kelch repeat-containing protein [Thermoplasmata archaeon]